MRQLPAVFGAPARWRALAGSKLPAQKAGASFRTPYRQDFDVTLPRAGRGQESTKHGITRVSGLRGLGDMVSSSVLLWGKSRYVAQPTTWSATLFEKICVSTHAVGAA